MARNAKMGMEWKCAFTKRLLSVVSSFNLIGKVGFASRWILYRARIQGSLKLNSVTPPVCEAAMV